MAQKSGWTVIQNKLFGDKGVCYQSALWASGKPYGILQLAVSVPQQPFIGNYGMKSWKGMAQMREWILKVGLLNAKT